MKRDLDELLGPKRVWGREPELARERAKEQTRRHLSAKRMACEAMARLHPDDWNDLFAQAKAKVLAQRGPLPGEED